MVKFAEADPWVVVLGSFLIFFTSDVAWHIAVVGVVHLLSGSENSWNVESIELISGLLDVVLDTIAIFIIDFSRLVAGHAQVLGEVECVQRPCDPLFGKAPFLGHGPLLLSTRSESEGKPVFACLVGEW